jgi:Tol biopolymer transport system component
MSSSRAVLAIGMVGMVTWRAALASEPVRLTLDGVRKLAPTFAHDGATLLYAAHERPNQVALMQLNWHDGSREKLLPKVANHQFDPALSVDGRYLGYSRATTSPQSELVIRDRWEQREVTFRPRDSRATVRYPSFAPDGSRVVFSLSDLGGQQIATVDLKGANMTIVAPSAGTSGWPSYSPDGKQIAFASSRDGDFEVYAMRADGSDVRRLTRSPGRDVRPRYSPDGKRIAFASTRDGNEEIYVIDADGSNPRNVTCHADRDTDPAWHPDGRRLAFVSDRGGRCELYLMELEPARPDRPNPRVRPLP